MKRLVLAVAAALVAASALPALADRDDHHGNHRIAHHRAFVDRDFRGDRGRHLGFEQGRFNRHRDARFDRRFRFADRDRFRDRDRWHR